MPHYHYLIIGGGMTADAAVKGIRSLDQQNSVAIISNDSHPPYSRPPLSKALWKGEAEDSIWKKTEEKNATIILSRSAVKLIPDEKTVEDERGEKYTYQKLLLATGGIVNQLPFNVPGIIYYRTYDDYKLLRQLSKNAKHIVVIGGGFIGSEVAAGLAMNDVAVTMIFPEKSLGARNYPESLSTFLNDYYETKGVEIMSGDGVEEIMKDGNSYLVKTKNGKSLRADAVVSGIGIKPNTSLAEQAGLTVNNGIILDEMLQTNHKDIFAAGDVANFFSPHLNKRIRVEHEDNALMSGELAGKNMAGAEEKYHHLPFFYSDLFDLGYEAVGELDARHQMIEDWKEQFREGVIYYLENGRVRGVLLWNTWGQVDHARALIADDQTFNAKKLKDFLPR